VNQQRNEILALNIIWFIIYNHHKDEMKWRLETGETTMSVMSDFFDKAIKEKAFGNPMVRRSAPVGKTYLYK